MMRLDAAQARVTDARIGLTLHDAHLHHASIGTVDQMLERLPRLTGSPTE